MIPAAAVTAWSVKRPWPTVEQVEQDLLLSRAICAISSDEVLSDELAFRGGTALHKLHLGIPYRYSEDLDYVRLTGGGIGEIANRLTNLGRSLGFDVRTQTRTEHPKIYWRTTSQAGIPLKIKIEINTRERRSAFPLIHIRHGIDSDWWSGTASIKTFEPEEPVVSKVRALFQRSKGRDLFDLWLSLTILDLDIDKILEAFTTYRPEGPTGSAAIANLARKLNDGGFRADLRPLVSSWPDGYSIDSAAELVTNRLLDKLD